MLGFFGYYLFSLCESTGTTSGRMELLREMMLESMMHHDATQQNLLRHTAFVPIIHHHAILLLHASDAVSVALQCYKPQSECPDWSLWVWAVAME
jgi:hypothetical protein